MPRSSYRPELLADALDPARRASDGPLYRRIADALVRDIRRGVLAPGARLPGTRPLSVALGVHRNTVLEAIQALASEGWLELRPQCGTFVAALGDVPAPAPRRAGTQPGQGPAAGPVTRNDAGFAWESRAPHPERLLREAREPARVIHLASGAPDPRLIPADLLARAWRRALRARGGALLDYGDPFGHAPLRAALAGFLAEHRGIACGPEHIVIVRGSQMGLALAGELLPRGATIGVEALGYRPAWDAFEAAGLATLPVPIDGEGLVVDALGAGLAGVYVTPHHQYPTGVMLSGPRRAQLLAHARRARLAILEDDYDHEFHFDGAPRRPLAAEDRHAQVLYIGTLSKILAPGLRLGFVVAPARLAAAIAARRVALDRQDDTVLSAAVTELIEDGSLARHARRLKRIFAERRELLFAALGRHLGGALSWTPPPGGLALWARVADDIDGDRWAAAALTVGVAVGPGREFVAGKRSALFASEFVAPVWTGTAGTHSRRVPAPPYLRLGFGRCDGGEIATGVQRLARALRGLPRKSARIA